MADFTYDGGDTGAGVASAANWVGALVSLTLIVGIAVWGYRLMVRDITGIPVVEAAQGPMRIAPEDPGGQAANNQGLAVNAVAGTGETEPAADRLVLAPAAPGLASEDLPLGAITPVARPVTAPAPQAEITPQPQPVTLQTDATTPSDDPIALLAEQIAAGVAPLSAQAPGEDAPVRVSLNGTEAEAQPTAAVLAGPGLARSLRPLKRPVGLRQASLAVAPTASSATAPAQAGEIDVASIPRGTRLVQIGAFDSEDLARSEWQRLQGRFGDYLDGKDRVIQRASSGGRIFYRLRAHGFKDLADARRFCAAFVAQNVDCIPVVSR